MDLLAFLTRPVQVGIHEVANGELMPRKLLVRVGDYSHDVVLINLNNHEKTTKTSIKKKQQSM